MYKFFKRFFDFIMALTMLLLLWLPMVIIAILIKCDSKGPVLFKQERLGLKGKTFKILKLIEYLNKHWTVRLVFNC